MMFLKRLATVIVFAAIGVPAIANVDQRIGGTVRDQSNAFVGGAFL